MPRRITPGFSNVDSVVQFINLIHKMSMIHGIGRMQLNLFVFHSVCSQQDPGIAGTIIDTTSSFINLLVQSECGKIRTRKSPNKDTFHTELSLFICSKIQRLVVTFHIFSNQNLHIQRKTFAFKRKYCYCIKVASNYNFIFTFKS